MATLLQEEVRRKDAGLNVETTTTLFSIGYKGKVKRKAENKSQSASKNGEGTKEEKKKPEKCFHCGAQGHYKKQCKKWLAWVEEVKKKKEAEANVASCSEQEHLFVVTTSVNSSEC